MSNLEIGDIVHLKDREDQVGIIVNNALLEEQGVVIVQVKWMSGVFVGEVSTDFQEDLVKVA
jgi:hypothetical protein